MKTLIDGTQVSDRSYYFLLDWNEQDKRETIFKISGQIQLCQLTIQKYMQLFKKATKCEINILTATPDKQK